MKLVDNLTAFTSYTFQLKAENYWNRGMGRFSAPIEETSREGGLRERTHNFIKCLYLVYSIKPSSERCSLYRFNSYQTERELDATRISTRKR